MSVITGVLAAIDTIPMVLDWSINSKNDLQKFSSSNTKGGTGRIAGNGDWSGKFSMQGFTSPVLPGDTFTFTGSIDGTNGATGLAMVDKVEIVVDIEGGKIIQTNVDFSSAGALTLGAAVATDATAKVPPSSVGCKIQVATALVAAAGATFTDLADVRTYTITLTRANKAYVSSSTAGSTARTKGYFDATFSANVYCSDFSTLPQSAVIRAVRLFVTATTYWQFEWAQFSDLSNLAVDIQNGSPVSATINGAHTVVASIAGTATYGTIKSPAGTTIFP